MLFWPTVFMEDRGKRPLSEILSVQVSSSFNNWKFYGLHKYENGNYISYNIIASVKSNYLFLEHYIAFVLQRISDQLQGYDFVAYHNYARRRYFELTQGNQFIFCASK
jgi:hypothetical protein